MADDPQKLSRRDLFKGGARGVGFLGLGAAAGFLTGRERKADERWQIDPAKCIQCLSLIHI